jgi:hypothetical protein
LEQQMTQIQQTLLYVRGWLQRPMKHWTADWSLAAQGQESVEKHSAG